MAKRNYIQAVILCLLLIIPFAGIPFAQADELLFSEYEGVPAEITDYSSAQERLDSMVEVAADEKSRLYYDPLTAQLAVAAKEGGNAWFSCPYNTDEAGAIGSTKGKILSILSLTYLDESLQQHEMNSFTDAAEAGQINARGIQNGVSVSLTVGRLEQKRLLPEVMPESSYQAFVLNQLTGQNLKRLNSFYRKYNLENYDDPAVKAEMLEKFPGLEDGIVYVCKDVNDIVAKELETYFKQTTYSYKQMEADRKQVYRLKKDAPEQTAIQAYFKLRLEYTLENGQLVVRLPAESIEYDKKHFTLLKIRLMEYFGAVREGEDGYIFVPDGSGAIFDFSRKSNEIITSQVYGHDGALNFDRTLYTKKQIYLPVYGVRVNGNAFLAVAEEGASAAELTVLSGEAETGYHRAGFAFNFHASDDFLYSEITGGGMKYTTLPKYAQKAFKGDYTLRFFLLEKEMADYSGMASVYREYLLKAGGLKERLTAQKLPLYYGALGAVEIAGTFLGFPVKRTEALTSFSDMKNIIKEQKQNGIETQNIRYLGWANGGLSHSVYNKAAAVKKLGGNKGYLELIGYTKQSNTGLYPDAELMFTRKNKLFDGYVVNRDTARQMDGTFARIYTQDYGSGTENKSKEFLLINTGVMKSNLNKLLKKWQSGGISLASLGSEVHSDFKSKQGLTRQESLQMITETLSEASDAHSLMFDGGNAYIFPYAEHLLNIDSTSSAYQHAAATVPFIQMVLHGSVPYSGAPLNLSSDTKKATLKAIENGEALYFIIAAKNSRVLGNTDYSEYFSVDYNDWKKRIVEIYNEVYSLTGDVYDQQITRHEFLMKDVAAVTYSGGKTIVVNYTNVDVTVSGINIKAESAAVIESSLNRGDFQ